MHASHTEIRTTTTVYVQCTLSTNSSVTIHKHFNSEAFNCISRSCDSWVHYNTGLEIATDTVANATNIFSLATKNSGLVAKVATRFLYILDLN